MNTQDMLEAVTTTVDTAMTAVTGSVENGAAALAAMMGLSDEDMADKVDEADVEDAADDEDKSDDEEDDSEDDDSEDDDSEDDSDDEGHDAEETTQAPAEAEAV